MKLSILIPTLPERSEDFEILYDTLFKQRKDLQLVEQVEILFDVSQKPIPIGTKRNTLLQQANGDYVCFIDDDDQVSQDYIRLLMYGVRLAIDCCSLRGIMTTDGGNPEVFEHSLKYKQWKTTENTIKYERYPNHLNCIKASIAKQFKFPEVNHGEDHRWSTAIHQSGLIKTEHYIEEVIYHYLYRTKK